MESNYKIPLSDIIKEFQLEGINLPEDANDIMVSSTEVSRPGLALSGFLEVFESFRIQIIGRAEHRYLSELSEAERSERLKNFLKLCPVAVIITSNLEPFDELKKYAKQYNVPLLSTQGFLHVTYCLFLQIHVAQIPPEIQQIIYSQHESKSCIYFLQ